MKETVLQFGTGNFLRGFVDFFIDRLNKSGLYDGKIVVVSPTDSKNIEKINFAGGKYNLILRGIENGKTVRERYEINSISRGINPYKDFDGFLSLSHNPDLRFIISNTTESGIVFDSSCNFGDCPPVSFPAKLTRFLYERYSVGLRGFVIFCCELIDSNGDKLKNTVLEYAKLWDLPKSFSEWINSENVFCNTLVDRIVTGFPKDEAEEIFTEIGYSDYLLNTAEVFHLWAVEGNFENELPLKTAGFNVIWTDDIRPYKKMKVSILNGAHTSAVFPSLLCGIDFVGESLKDENMRKFIEKCIFGCVLSVIGESDENIRFAKSVLERFSNPYIKHSWEAISLNSTGKFKERVVPTLCGYYEKYNKIPTPLALSLSALIKYYKTHTVSDSEYAVNRIKNGDLPDILSDEKLWGKDLSFVLEKVTECAEKIENCGISEAVKWSIT